MAKKFGAALMYLTVSGSRTIAAAIDRGDDLDVAAEVDADIEVDRRKGRGGRQKQRGKGDGSEHGELLR